MDLWGSYKKGVLQAYTMINYVERRKRGKIGKQMVVEQASKGCNRSEKD